MLTNTRTNKRDGSQYVLVEVIKIFKAYVIRSVPRFVCNEQLCLNDLFRIAHLVAEVKSPSVVFLAPAPLWHAFSHITHESADLGATFRSLRDSKRLLLCVRCVTRWSVGRDIIHALLARLILLDVYRCTVSAVTETENDNLD